MNKIYTEEQLHKLIFKYRQQLTEFSFNKPTVQNLIDELTPIELPSDEEIEESANGYIVSKWEYAQDENKESFIEGAKWMRDKIIR